MIATTTNSGQRAVSFRDLRGQPCVVQESRLMRSHTIYLGSADHTMHLDISTVRALLPWLSAWAETGKLVLPVEEEA